MKHHVCAALMVVMAGPASAQPVIEALPDEGARHVWQSRHFRIDHDFPLNEGDVRHLAAVAEGLRAAIEGHDMPWFSPPRGRPVISLFARSAGFTGVGGPEHAAGFYDHRNARVLLRAVAMFREVRGGRLVALPTADALLIHELTHLHTHGVNGTMPQWFVEGVAEYFAAAHAGGGRFDFGGIDARIIRHLQARTLARRPEIEAITVAGVAGLDQAAWDDALAAVDETRRYRPYATALMLVHYHLHGGEARAQWLREALEEASRPLPRRQPARKPALATDGVEESLARFWSSRGLTVRFVAAD